MPKILIEQKTQGKRFLHESLASALGWLDDEIEAICSGEIQPGWKDRVISGVIVLASYNEAFFNAIGQQAISDWKHRAKLSDKLRMIRKQLTPNIEANRYPFVSVEELRELRNEICHPQPEIDDAEVVEIVEVEQERDSDFWLSGLNHSIEKKITYESYKKFRDASESYRKLVFDASGLSHWDLKSSQEISSTYIRHVGSSDN
jgi:hypothetical protein